MSFIAAIIALMVSLPIALIVHKKYMRSFEHVWGLSELKRADEIQRLKGNAMPIAYGLSLCAMMVVIGLAILANRYGL